MVATEPETLTRTPLGTPVTPNLVAAAVKWRLRSSVVDSPT